MSELRLAVGLVRPDEPAFDAQHWDGLSGDVPDIVRQNRGILLAFAEVFANDEYVVSAWRGDVLAGVVLAKTATRHHTDERILATGVPGPYSTRTCSSFWIRADEDRAVVTRALLEKLIAHARTLDIARLVLAACPTEDEITRGVATELGFRAVIGVPDFRIEIEAPLALDAYLERLTKTQSRGFRRDMRRAEEAGARLVDELPAQPSTLAAAGVLVAALYERKNAYEIPRPGARPLFAALGAQLRPDDIGVFACYEGDAMVGCLVYHPAGSATRFAYAGHREDLPWKVHMALLAPFVAAQLARGVTRILLGFSNEPHKIRLGAAAVDHVHYSLRMPSPAAAR